MSTLFSERPLILPLTAETSQESNSFSSQKRTKRAEKSRTVRTPTLGNPLLFLSKLTKSNTSPLRNALSDSSNSETGKGGEQRSGPPNSRINLNENLTKTSPKRGEKGGEREETLSLVVPVKERIGRGGPL